MCVQRVVIFVNGVYPDLSLMSAVLRENDFIIGVDGGSLYAGRLGLIPDILVGDFDSLPGEDLERLQRVCPAVYKYPVAKDQTDLELALEHAKLQHPEEILIAGGMGGRSDHFLGNILLLVKQDLLKWNIRFDDGLVEAGLIRSCQEFSGQAGDMISLIPFDEYVTGVNTLGLRYPLNDEDLHFGETRGISNQMLSDFASVRVKAGLLCFIHTRTAKGA